MEEVPPPYFVATLGIRTVLWEPVGGSEAEKRGKGLPGRRATNFRWFPDRGLLDVFFPFLFLAMVMKAAVETFDWEKETASYRKRNRYPG